VAAARFPLVLPVEEPVGDGGGFIVAEGASLAEADSPSIALVMVDGHIEIRTVAPQAS